MTASTPRVVAIDGAAGSGKSTLARRLAERLSLPYINTGLMYRALTAAALDAGASPDDEEALARLMRDLRFTLSAGELQELRVEHWDADRLIILEVEANVSAVSRHGRVRAFMRALQRDLGLEHGAVMEGRDIGSVVFADAPVKLYLEADEHIRAERRADERLADPPSAGTRDQVEASLLRRDAGDASTNPHEPAPGAVVIATSGLDVEATLSAALGVVADLAPELIT